MSRRLPVYADSECEACRALYYATAGWDPPPETIRHLLDATARRHTCDTNFDPHLEAA